MATFRRNRGVLADLACLTIVGVFVIYILFFVEPARRGFFCDDESIRYPLVPNTVSTAAVVALGFTVPAAMFVVVEGFRLFDTSTPRDSWQSVSFSLLKNLYEFYSVFLLGMGLVSTTTEVGKHSIGRLRPHFYEACNPYPEDVCGPGKEHVYVTDFQCTGDPKVVEDARQSFPSGHASVAFYAAIYTVVFLQQRMTWPRSRLPVILCQFILLMLSWFTALSRVADHRHHPTDVLAGIVIGSGWALFMAYCAIDMRLVSNNANKEELRSLSFTSTNGPMQV